MCQLLGQPVIGVRALDRPRSRALDRLAELLDGEATQHQNTDQHRADYGDAGKDLLGHPPRVEQVDRRSGLVGVGVAGLPVIDVQAVMSHEKPRTTRYWDRTSDLFGVTLGEQVGSGLIRGQTAC
ncbi:MULTISPECIES: hypothetical protein [unclassified Micromonospora]|uniref:hypothetical protein n=1 Tax=unclassified Micromonospora TaxID=2617518 RepID=UPI002FF278A8